MDDLDKWVKEAELREKEERKKKRIMTEQQ